MIDKIYFRKKSKELREKRKSENKCVDCGVLLVDKEKYRCIACKEKHNISTHNRFNIFKEKNICRSCQKQIGSNGTKYFCEHCSDINRKRRNNETYNTKKRCIDFLGSKCAVCGLKTEFLSVYDFHHKNPEEKERGVRDLLCGSWEKLERELIKCILVCSNCHRIIHFKEDNR